MKIFIVKIGAFNSENIIYFYYTDINEFSFVLN